MKLDLQPFDIIMSVLQGLEYYLVSVRTYLTPEQRTIIQKRAHNLADLAQPESPEIKELQRGKD